MECYKILSRPMSRSTLRNYKGLYRCGPLPQPNSNSRMLALWHRYVQYIEPLLHMGVTTQLTLDELKELADLATQDTGEDYEVVCLNDILECRHPAEYYGIDVTGVGGYSMVGENFFTDSKDKANGVYHLYDVINQYFRGKLNSNGLFDTLEDALSFRAVLNDLSALSPGSVESEDWRAVYIFKVI